MLATPDATYNGSAYSSKAWKIGGGYAVDAFALNGVFEKINNNIGSGSSRAWYLSGKYNVTSADTLKLAYTNVNNDVADNANSGAKQYSVGYDHKMSNRTTLYALYTQLKNDTDAGYVMGWNSGSTSVSGNAPWLADVSSTGQNVSAFSVGMKHAF
jgi:predicted porin